MKKLTFIFLISANALFAQINVFTCFTEQSTISQEEFENTDTDLFKNCIFFEGNTSYEANSLINKSIKAHHEIRFTSDFHDKAEGDKSHHYSNTNKADFEVVFLNPTYNDLDHVIKYDKLEIGTTLPNGVQEKVNNFINAPDENYNPLQPDLVNQINPFLEWEIKVETFFKHIESGFEKTIFGFYYQDFERDLDNEEWDEVVTPYPFLTRYSPPKNGKWQAYTRITVGNTNEVYQSDPYFFTVIEGGQHGFVEVHENKRNLKLGDRMIFPVGHNLAWAGFWEGWTDNDIVQDNFRLWQEYQEGFAEYAEHGSRFARMHFHNKLTDIEWEHVGNYKGRLNFAWEIDKLIDLFEDKNMLIQLTLMMQHQLAQINEAGLKWDFDGDYRGPNNDENSNPPGYWSELGLRNVVDYISDPTSIKYLKQRMRYLISRYCYATSIYQLDIHSEINLALADENHYYSGQQNNTANRYENSDDTKLKVFNYHSIMSDYIKNTLNHKEHLLSVNYSDWPFIINEFPLNKLDPDNSYGLANIDVIGLNTYSNYPNKLYISEPNNILYMRLIIWERYGIKPIVLGEVGTAEAPPCWSDLSEMPIAELMTYGFTGIAGFNTWHALDNPLVFPPVKRASDHMNGDDVINTLSDGNGEWILSGEKNENVLIEDNLYQHFYYKSANKEKIVGFVKNNTYNFYNYGFSPCDAYAEIENRYGEIKIRTWEQNDFKISNLMPNHNYRIHYYSFHDYEESDCFNANAITGNQNLKHPIISKIYWYVAYVEDCMNGLARQEENYEYKELKNKILNENKSIHNSEESLIYPESPNVDKKIVIFPNPTESSFYIDSSDKTISKILLSDLKGNMLIEDLHYKNKTKIDISSLSSGIYTLAIISDLNVTFFKIIKL